MVLEGIVTTRDPAGAIHIAPMGPIVDESMRGLQLRPFKTSQTYANLVTHVKPGDNGCGVFHIVDDVLLLAQSAVGRLSQVPPTFPATTVPADVLAQTCRWYEFKIVAVDSSQERAQLAAQVTHTGRLRDFIGFNRGKNAVLEAAILATRLHLLPRAKIRSQLAPLKTIVQKTGGEQELQAFALLEDVIRNTPEPTGG